MWGAGAALGAGAVAFVRGLRPPPELAGAVPAYAALLAAMAWRGLARGGYSAPGAMLFLLSDAVLAHALFNGPVPYERLAGAVPAYAALLAAMAWRGLARGGYSAPGAMLFLLSDAVLAHALFNGPVPYERLAGAVPAYAALLAAMAWRGLARGGYSAPGAMLFLLSDAVLAHALFNGPVPYERLAGAVPAYAALLAAMAWRGLARGGYSAPGAMLFLLSDAVLAHALFNGPVPYERLAGAVPAYAALLAAMAWRGLARGGYSAPGAMLFLLSDAVLAHALFNGPVPYERLAGAVPAYAALLAAMAWRGLARGGYSAPGAMLFLLSDAVLAHALFNGPVPYERVSRH
ncbi:unnamed protein product [Chilo suppressalis]|uniref:Lysoplasmalogenase TMEM86B n=1 Tax=Chilo suppressalis TaxID=168631 RepID=A0ABN8AWH9_CHISP|nr:unnamed protein product [Chilo suppressalis]